MTFIALTRKERAAMAVLLAKHQEFPSNTWGFHAASIGQSNAAACRRLEKTGFIAIDRQAGNCFRYALTDAGRERAASAALP